VSYSYLAERPWLFTEDGQVALLRVRDNAQRLLKLAGAFKTFKATSGIGAGDTFRLHALIDRLVELEELRCINKGVAGQDEVYVAGPKWSEQL
jgi:hypothetical protein